MFHSTVKFGLDGADVQLGATGTFGAELVPPVPPLALPPHPLFVPAGIATCGTEIVFEEKSQANHILIVVEVAPVLGEGRVLLPTLKVQVAVPMYPFESPNRGCAVGPEQLDRLKRLSSSSIENRGF